jgi:tRNA 2-thiouridine synthesizing protein D
MKFAIAVYGAPASSQAPFTALRFARAVLARGHTILRVFFYYDAVAIANALVVPPQGEPDIGAFWGDFGREHGVELGVCIAAALRRGIVDATEAERYGLAAHNLREPFRLLGLGQFVEMAANADRLVTFPE